MSSEMVNILDTISTISFEELIKNIVDVGKDIFACEYFVFYEQEKKNEEIRKIISSGDKIFPEGIPAVEIKKFKQIDYWEPGKRVLSEVQRVGRVNNLQTIITVPLKVEEEKPGLLVFAFKESRERNEYAPSIQVFSRWAAALLKLQKIMERFSQETQKVSIENDQYSQFYENSSDCAIILNNENVILDFNNNASRFLKYSPIELLNQNAAVIFQNSEIKAELQKKTESLITQEEIPVYIYDREGSTIPVFYKIIPVELMNVHQKLLIIKDATEKVDMDNKIKQFENKAAIGEVVADFAHEVRNPINNLSTGLQLLKKKIDEGDPNWTTINRMQEDCLRMNDLMESVLSYSRQKVENFKDVDVELLIRRIISRMNVKFNRTGVSVLIKAETKNKIVFGDQRSLEQVFINLVNNAFDAIKQTGGTISLQIEQEEKEKEFLKVSVSDTGPGIPPEIQEKLFEPFVTDKPKGTGLGLAITKRMVEAHQGKIELETYPGGTIFKVFLPIHELKGEQA